MGATRSQPNSSGRVAPRHPPRLGDWQVRPDDTALQFVQETDDDGRTVKHFRCVDTLGLLLKGGSISAAQYDAAQLSFEPSLPLLMTEKDAVKCRAFAAADWWYLAVDAAPTPAFVDWLDGELARLIPGS